jgi:phospholipase D1/2
VAINEGSSDSNSNKLNGKWNFDETSWYESTSPAAVHLREDSKLAESETAMSGAGKGKGKSKEREGAGKVQRFHSVKELDEIVETMEDEIKKIDFMNDLQVTRRRAELQEIEEEAEYDYSCQILRSVGSWSIGCQPNLKERSVHSAYLDLIRTAKRFIYIENQFFISMTADSLSTVKNEIANEIFRRVQLAVLKQEEFKVWVIIPLIPGFAGELDDAEAVIPRVIMHWQYNTISRGGDSLISRVASLGVDPSRYIRFFGLRTHAVVAGKPTTEIVYLHSKLIIADDQRAICGSANINERSMRGSRDSEVCVLVEEGPQKAVKGREGSLQVSEGIFNFRVRLFHEHFGSDLDASDPASDELFRAVEQRTRKNTALYREIFRCYPDDYIKTLAEITLLRAVPPNMELYQELKGEIIGFAVEYPLEFLKEEDLLVGATLYPDSLSV